MHCINATQYTCTALWKCCYILPSIREAWLFTRGVGIYTKVVVNVPNRLEKTLIMVQDEGKIEKKRNLWISENHMPSFLNQTKTINFPLSVSRFALPHFWPKTESGKNTSKSLKNVFQLQAFLKKWSILKNLPPPFPRSLFAPLFGYA